jgi:hypothetical protein
MLAEAAGLAQRIRKKESRLAPESRQSQVLL